MSSIPDTLMQRTGREDSQLRVTHAEEIRLDTIEEYM